jgi:hypothetical protein
LEDVFKRALAVTTGDRFATAGEFWQAVRASLNMPEMLMTGEPGGARSFAFGAGGTNPQPSGAAGPTLHGAPGAPAANSKMFSSAATELGAPLSSASATRANVVATNPAPAAALERRRSLRASRWRRRRRRCRIFFLMGRSRGDAHEWSGRRPACGQRRLCARRRRSAAAQEVQREDGHPRGASFHGGATTRMRLTRKNPLTRRRSSSIASIFTG